jgi:uncharacterized protein YerC
MSTDFAIPYKRKSRPAKTKWDTVQNRKRLLESFTLAQKWGFMKEFLDDLLLESEIERWGKRIEALHMLFAGTPYRSLTKFTGLSPAVIARISKKTSNKTGGFWQLMEWVYPHGYKYRE